MNRTDDIQQPPQLIKQLYAYKSGGGKKRKAKTAVSPFAGTNTFNVDLDGIASGTSTMTGGKLQSTGSLSPGLRKNFDLATSGLEGNLRYLNQSPDQQFQTLQSGGNPFFNEQKEYLDRAFSTRMGQLGNSLGSRGLQNSTVAGSMAAGAAQDAALRENALINQSLDFQNQRALQNAAFQQSNVLGLPQLAFQPAALSNQNLMGARNTDAQVAMFNADQQNKMAMMNAQLDAARSTANRQMWGSIAGSVAGAGLQAALMRFGLPGNAAGGATAGGAAPPSGIAPGEWSPNLMTYAQPVFSQPFNPSFGSGSIFGQYTNQQLGGRSPFTGSYTGI